MEITYKIVNYIIKAQTEIYLPDFKGSAFRGGFGNIFRKITCVLKRFDCLDCPIKQKCIYAYVFETIPDVSSNIMNMHKYEKVPHPFIFEPPLDRKKTFYPDEKLSLKVILVGKGIEYLPYFTFTIAELGEVGIGKGRGKFKIEEIVSSKVGTLSLVNSNPSDKKVSKVDIRAITPIRIKHNRQLTDNLEFSIFIRALLRRLSLLYYFHVENKKPPIDVHKLLGLSEQIQKVKENTFWYDWERYSSRQNTRMKLGGILGEITYSGHLTPFVSYIKAGEILHVGKGTSFGLGKYEIVDME